MPPTPRRTDAARSERLQPARATTRWRDRSSGFRVGSLPRQVVPSPCVDRIRRERCQIHAPSNRQCRVEGTAESESFTVKQAEYSGGDCESPATISRSPATPAVGRTGTGYGRGRLTSGGALRTVRRSAALQDPVACCCVIKCAQATAREPMICATMASRVTSFVRTCALTSPRCMTAMLSAQRNTCSRL